MHLLPGARYKVLSTFQLEVLYITEKQIFTKNKAVTFKAFRI